ncbi:9669_t:CDS:1, partial [Scutellospora calospora]
LRLSEVDFEEIEFFFDNILNITDLELKDIKFVTKFHIVKLFNLKHLSLIDMNIDNDDISFIMTKLKNLHYLNIHSVDCYKRYSEKHLVEASIYYENMKILEMGNHNDIKIFNIDKLRIKRKKKTNI